MEIIRISVIGIAGIVLAILVKEAKPEYSFYLTFAAGIAILFFSAGRLSDLLGSIREIQQYLPIENTYMDLLLKMVGITYVGQFSASICRDAGYASVAGQIELFARLSVLAISMPILTALLETIHEFLG
ncbi:MAG: stage III sporulation protein AD [Clostridiales bacterium]|uniref:Stage III sporulation protein AD n=1 Tax=Candidatus Pullilachnospira stercoravium TaxID=2840913 RepID=A0A9D1NVG0_9FIRM|nr:stage III sporulation protein AD [Clostridiales bacterium]HIV13714.1 stage III sporulation protein AD [Candidatus Pullilachnospira stercoravium]